MGYELVYLWIGKYRNIKNQGFPLSPNFEVTPVLENGELKKLIIDKKKNDYSVFPSYLNLRALIGKNGSGKSSVIEVLWKVLDGKLRKSVFFILLNKKKKEFLITADVEIFSSFTFEFSKQLEKEGYKHRERIVETEFENPPPKDKL